MLILQVNGEDEFVETWSVETGKYLGEQATTDVPLQWQSHLILYVQIAWEPAGERVTIAREDTIDVYKDDKVIFTVENADVALWSFDGSLLATGLFAGSELIQIWDTSTWTVKTTIKHVNMRGITWHPAENWLVTINPRFRNNPDYQDLKDVLVIDAEDGSIINGFDLPEDIYLVPTLLRWSPDGSYLLATFSSSDLPVMWDTTTGDIIAVEIPNLSYPDWNETGVIGLWHLMDVLFWDFDSNTSTKLAGISEGLTALYTQWSPSGNYFLFFIDVETVMFCPFDPEKLRHLPR